MTTSFKKALLLGTALVAVGAAFTPMTARAADEFLVDANDSGTFTTSSPDETQNTALTIDATNDNYAIRIDASGTLSFASTRTIGNASTLSTAVVAGATGQTLTLDDASTDDAANTITVTGDISKGSYAALSLTIAGNDQDATADVLNVDVNGALNLGTGTFTIDTDTNAGNTVAMTLSGSLTATATVLRDDGAGITLTFDGTSAQTVSGTINGHTDADGALVVANAAGVTFSGIIGGSQDMNSITVNSGAVATFSATADATSFVNNGTVYVGRNVVVNGQASGFSGTGTWYIEVNDDNTTLAVADFGQLGSSGAISLTGDTVVFNVTGSVGASTSGTTVSSVFAGGGAAVAAATVSDNSGLYNFNLVANGSNFDVVATKIATTALGRDTNNDNLVTLLDGFLGSGTAALNTLGDLYAKGGNGTSFEENLESFLPSVDAGAVDTVVDVASQSVGVTDLRLASLRSGEETGAVAGQLSNGMEVWLQGFGKLATQDKRGNVDGYEADTYGAVVGIDTADVMDGATLGLAVSYGMTDVESDNANTTETDIDSYQVSLYGEYDLGDAAFVNTTLAYGRNSIDQKRNNVAGVAGAYAEADYDSSQYIATVGIGRTLPLASGVTITPNTGVNFQHVSIDSYRETGTSAALLSVDTDSINILELGVGAEVAFDAIDVDAGMLTPAIDFGYRYDVIGDAVEASSTFTGGGAAFKTTGADPQQGKFNIGASLAYDVDSAMNVKVSYDYEMKGEDYSAHAGFVRAGYKF